MDKPGLVPGARVRVVLGIPAGRRKARQGFRSGALGDGLLGGSALPLRQHGTVGGAAFRRTDLQPAAAGLYPEHDIFIQLLKLKNTLRQLMGDDPITHLDEE